MDGRGGDVLLRGGGSGGGEGGCDLHGPLCCTSLGAFFFFFGLDPFGHLLPLWLAVAECE